MAEEIAKSLQKREISKASSKQFLLDRKGSLLSGTHCSSVYLHKTQIKSSQSTFQCGCGGVHETTPLTEDL